MDDFLVAKTNTGKFKRIPVQNVIRFRTWSLKSGQETHEFMISYCQDGYPRKKAFKRFMKGIEKLKGKKVRVL